MSPGHCVLAEGCGEGISWLGPCCTLTQSIPKESGADRWGRAPVLPVVGSGTPSCTWDLGSATVPPLGLSFSSYTCHRAVPPAAQFSLSVACDGPKEPCVTALGPSGPLNGAMQPHGLLFSLLSTPPAPASGACVSYTVGTFLFYPVAISGSSSPFRTAAYSIVSVLHFIFPSSVHDVG